jgi:replicative DNA helicase
MDTHNLDFVRWEAPDTARQEESGVPPLPTGIKDLDDRIGGGLHPGSVYRLSGRPAKGKTTCALNITRCVALGVDHDGRPMRDGHNRPHPVLLFSLEHPLEQIYHRIRGEPARTAGHETPTGGTDRSQVVGIFNMPTPDHARATIYVDASAPLDICDIVLRARDVKTSHGIELVIIDYLQLCASRECACLGRQAETSAILQALRNLAVELHLPVLVVEQARRPPIPAQGTPT